jgi:hypothetical protein
VGKSPLCLQIEVEIIARIFPQATCIAKVIQALAKPNERQRIKKRFVLGNLFGKFFL